MKILIVARSLPFHCTGGMEVVAWDLACSLQADGHHITILTTQLDDKTVFECYKINGVTLHVLDTAPGKYTSAWWNLSRKYALDNIQNFDVVLGVSAAANAMLYRQQDSHRPIFVFQAHGTSWDEFLSKWRQRSAKSWISSLKNLYWGVFKDWIYRRYDGVVAIGDRVEKQLRESPGTWLRGSTPLCLISNGIPENQFSFDFFKRDKIRKEINLTNNDILILTLCRLHPQKGVMIGLEAFAEALKQNPNLFYAIVGDGPQFNDLVMLAKTLEVSHRVYFAGRIERQSVTDWYCAGDVFLFPTQRQEGLPLNLLEALACGLPVIASEGAGDTSLPINFIPKDSLVGFYNAILQLATKHSSTQTERHSKLPATYSISTSSTKYIKFFEELRLRKEVK